MADNLPDHIPALDLADFRSGDPARKAKFVKDLGEAYQSIGFIALKNHGLSDAQTQELYHDVQAFFQLPDAAKQSYEVPELAGQRGYISKVIKLMSPCSAARTASAGTASGSSMGK